MSFLLLKTMLKRTKKKRRKRTKKKRRKRKRTTKNRKNFYLRAGPRKNTRPSWTDSMNGMPNCSPWKAMRPILARVRKNDNRLS
jgi:hypothetical protein